MFHCGISWACFSCYVADGRRSTSMVHYYSSAIVPIFFFFFFFSGYFHFMWDYLPGLAFLLHCLTLCCLVLFILFSSPKHLVDYISSCREFASLSSWRILRYVGNTAAGYTPRERTPMGVALFLQLFRLRVLSVSWGGRLGWFTFRIRHQCCKSAEKPLHMRR